MQRQTGIDVLTDGEYRRSMWSGAWTESVEGLGRAPYDEPAGTGSWQGPHAQEANAAITAVMPIRAERLQDVVVAKLRQTRRLTGHESGFLKQHAHGPYKVTMPGVMMTAANWYRPGISDAAYPTRADLVNDMVAIMRREVQALLDEGTPYIQFDSLRYIWFMDPVRSQTIRERGGDLQREIEETVAADNACIEGLKREGVTFGLHICRGNNRSAWLMEGGYEAIAEVAFSQLQVDRLLLEYDTERAGGFEPLRFVPKGKIVVLGLISSKEPQLESQDELLRRIEEATKYVPLDSLALSPQCGFASTAPGNLLTWDEQRRKLELVADTARKVWG